jgi:hypothetical protein
VEVIIAAAEAIFLSLVIPLLSIWNIIGSGFVSLGSSIVTRNFAPFANLRYFS